IGVANAAVSFERNSRSSGTKGQSVYLNSGTGNIENLINNHEVSGNASFKCGQRVAAEVNMNYKILRFFVDGIEQPNYDVNIPPAIRFFAFLWQEGSSFEVTQFINIPSTSSSASGVEGSRSWEWGKEWVVDKVRQPRVPPYQTIPPDYMNVVPPPFILPPYIQPHMQSSTQVPGPPIGNWQQPSGSRDSQSPPPRSPCTIPRSPSPSFYGIPSLYVQPPMPRQMSIELTPSFYYFQDPYSCCRIGVLLNINANAFVGPLSTILREPYCWTIFFVSIHWTANGNWYESFSLKRSRPLWFGVKLSQGYHLIQTELF
ncbi:MAG: hypothetical protein EZS28_022079, partial [Streblomastix strix]